MASTSISIRKRTLLAGRHFGAQPTGVVKGLLAVPAGVVASLLDRLWPSSRLKEQILPLLIKANHDLRQEVAAKELAAVARRGDSRSDCVRTESLQNKILR